MDETGLLKAYNSIYLEIITRYKEYIEEKEELYLTDLPRLITPADEQVLLLAKELEGNFPVYNYEDNFEDAMKLAYAYIRDRIAPVSLPIQFWLKPSQTIRYGAGDIFDKAVLLCSTLIAIGNVSSRVMVIVKNNDRHFIVYSESKGRIIGIDMEFGLNEYKNMDELLGKNGIDQGAENDDEIMAYEFNDKFYRNIV
ncbi:MAG: hypothetical protein M1569_03065 [Candidatus Marsarchaeota archaeon]|nr:hypothetical protein [Candidatus Marsarchaeota archaeon]MCL5413355.1 hypothetical protein [Candidatus Marsarchaeota archaeon]